MNSNQTNEKSDFNHYPQATGSAVKTPEFQNIQQSFHEENQKLDSLFCKLQDIAERIKPLIRKEDPKIPPVVEEGIVSEFNNQLFYLRNSNNNLSEVISHLQEIFGTK